jgi:hypothetical protein
MLRRLLTDHDHPGPTPAPHPRTVARVEGAFGAPLPTRERHQPREPRAPVTTPRARLARTAWLLWVALGLLTPAPAVAQQDLAIHRLFLDRATVTASRVPAQRATHANGN